MKNLENLEKTRKISKRKRDRLMAGKTSNRKTNRNKLVESEKGPKFKNKGITWLGTAQDGALRKTVHFGPDRKVP